MLSATNQFIPTAADILDASLVELNDYLFSDAFESAEHRLYCTSLINYLRAENDNLKSTLSQMTLHPEMQTLTLLRLQNRNAEYVPATVEEVKKILLRQDWLAADAAFALGMTYLRFRMNEDARLIFKQAYQLLTKAGAHKKSIKALLNTVVAESRIDNKKKLIHDYEFIAKKAAEAGATEAEGICHQNISKELQLVGAFELALKHSHKAIALQEADSGSLPYFESLLHRCHVLISLNRYKEAHADFEKSKISSHQQIIEARKAIEKLLGAETGPRLEYLEPAWRSKLAAAPAEAMTKMECEFVDLIKGKKVERQEIISQLYGPHIDWLSAKNRFKVFLNRFKNRYPQLIAEEGSLIFLADENLSAGLSLNADVK